MKKKSMFRYLALCLVAVLLWGCGGEPKSTEPSATGDSHGTTAPSGSGQVSSIEPTADPEKKQDFAIVYNDKCDYDVYWELGGFTYYCFYILSREPIDISTVTATVPGDFPASFSVVNDDASMTWETAAGVPSMDFNDYIYQCYRGMDWKEAARLYIAAQGYGPYFATQEELEEAIAAEEAWELYANQYMDDYNAIKESYMKNGPYFHAYIVYIEFEEPTGDHVAEQVELSVGEQTYTLDIGQIRLHEKLPEELHGIGYNGVSDCSLGSYAYMSPWNDGYVQVSFDFLADTDLKLKRLYALNGEKTQVQKIRVQHRGETGMNIDTEWDGSSPVEIDSGERVNFWIDTSVPDMAGQSVYYGTINLILEYEADGQEAVFAYCMTLAATVNYYELGAIYLDGIDLKSYYTDYYNVWQARIREN